MSGRQFQGEFEEFLENMCRRTMAGEKVKREEILALLEIDPESKSADLLRKKAREISRHVVGNAGRIWSAVGIEHRPCAMNCKFCSFGEKWGLVKDDSEWNEADILAAAKAAIADGASWFTLRTNEFYTLDRLVELAQMIRANVPGEYELAVNTGELTEEEASRLASAGVSGVYHTWRLGEGDATSFDPEDRKATMRAVGASQLRLYHLVEPVGPEHSNEEIADRILFAMDCNASLNGIMTRVNVPGTPFENSGSISSARLAQLVAITRICAGSRMENICVAPPSLEALKSGANVLTIEIGSVPRSEDTQQKTMWKGFGMNEAKQLLEEAGLNVREKENDHRV